MSVLVVGLSHKSAPVATLERAAVSGDTLAKLLVDLTRAEPVAETFVISTCNRLEVYTDVDRFHAGVTAICELIARHCGIPAQELTPHLYIHYEDSAVRHLLAVACGLDSLVVGEEQIVGQVRSGIRMAAEQGAIGRVLGDLARLALRAAKRARAETGIGLDRSQPAEPGDRGGLPQPACSRLGRHHSRCPEPGGTGCAGRRRGLNERARGGHGLPGWRGKPRGGQPDAPTRREAGCQVERHPDPGHWTCWPARRHGGGGRRDLLHRRGRPCDHGRRGARQAARGPRVP